MTGASRACRLRRPLRPRRHPATGCGAADGLGAQGHGHESVKAKMFTLGNTLQYLSPRDFAAFWDDQDAKLKPVLEVAKQQQGK